MSSELAFLLHSQAKCPINCMGLPMQMKIHVKISNNKMKKDMLRSNPECLRWTWS